jgi:hypothetical protein
MTVHPLAGHFSVDASARRIRHYRWLEERLMRTLGGWIALTPELPVKLLFGRHVWDCAQHADLWGRRLPELRSPAHVGEPPSEGFARLMDVIDGRQARHESVERVVAVYCVIKPQLVAAYEEHLADANAVYEPPTRRILTRCAEEEHRHIAAASVVLERLVRGEGRRRTDEWERHLSDELARVGGLVTGGARRPPVAAAQDPSWDLVALDSAFDSTVLGQELTTVVAAHRVALVSGDEAAVADRIAPPVRSPIVELYRSMAPIAEAAVVACARIGAYRIVKLALRGPRALSVVQLEWRRGGGDWRIVAGDVVRSEPLT